MSTGERDRDLRIETKDQFKMLRNLAAYLTRTDAFRLTSPVQGVPKQKREASSYRSTDICIGNVASRRFPPRNRTTSLGCRYVVTSRKFTRVTNTVYVN